MQSVRSIALVLLALAALSAVASAYEPIADSKVPSAKAAAKPEATPVNRKLLQTVSAHANTNMESVSKSTTMWGGYLVTPPFWAAGMRSGGAVAGADATERRFDMTGK